MFFTYAFDTTLNLILALICSLCVGFVFLRMISTYSQKRKNKVYAANRNQAPSIAVFSGISKLLFMSSMLITLFSYWFNSVLFMPLYSSQVLQVLGALLVLFGYLKLSKSFNDLGKNYSPSFDAYLPHNLIKTGHYQIIRHPIYLYNLFVSFGLAISSGSIIVIINAFIGFFCLLRIISIEETYLKQHFSGYQDYTKNTWRLIPYFY